MLFRSLGGSYYVETLTNEMEKKIVAAMNEVDAQGGIVNAVAEGMIQAQVSAQAYLHQKDLESGKFRKIGVNCYVDEDEETPEVELHPYNEQDAQTQVEGLKNLRNTRDSKKVESSLQQLRKAAQMGLNVMPALIDSVKVYATVGEMTNVMVEVFGRYQEPIRF